MKSSTEYKPSHSTAILCVGNPGTSKTRIMLGLPYPGIIDADMNLNSGVRLMTNPLFKYTQPAIIEDEEILVFLKKSKSFNPLSDLHKSMRVGGETPIELRWLLIERGIKQLILDPEVKTLCVDSLTAVGRWLLEYCEAELALAGINVKKEYLAKYANLINLMTRFVTLMRTSGKYVFVNVHQTADQNDLTKAWYYALSIPGQLKDTLGGLFTDVWGTSTQVIGDEVKYYINTRPTNLHVALKTSVDLAPKIDITNKLPHQIWELLEPKLSFNVSPKTVTS